MTKHALPLVLCAAASSFVALSCLTPKAVLKTEDEIVSAGASLFAKGDIAEAETAWAEIPDAERRSLYISFAEAYSRFDASVAAAEKALSNAEPLAAVVAAKGLGTFPAAPAGLAAVDPRDSRGRLARVGDEAGNDLIALAAGAERAADAQLASARSGKAKEGAETAGKAAAGFAAAGELFSGASAWIPEAAEGELRVGTKAKSAEELRKALLKSTLLSFPDRMGEVFSRSTSSAGKLGDKELLSFNAETAAMISGGLSDFERIVSEYPDLLDSAAIDRLRDSARGLSARFARIEAVVKAVKDRGKPVMPIIIGIFNPEPDDPQRSRPASFSGSAAGGSEWWWGIADIPKGLAQDLVVTMSDQRPVRIYSAGVGPGGKKPASDLVNPLFKVGNSWPVLNAGARLENGVFHIEVGPGRADGYSGEAVVYKSFMMRTR